MYDIAIIGGGASGLAASISAKKTDKFASVAIVEALPRVGKKILATGNGRCNLTNTDATAESYNNVRFVNTALKEYPPIKILEFFESIGLRCISDSDGRVYPMSNTAASVLDCLRFEAENLGIELICNTHVDSVKKTDYGFILNNTIKTRKLILATGGKASPSQGSDGSGYALLKSLGHSVTEIYPALVQLTVKETLVKQLKGTRVKANVSLYDGEELADSSHGEVLFTDYGLSGIAIMDISRTASKINGKCVLDMMTYMSCDEIVNFLIQARKRNPQLSAESVMSGILPKKVGQAVLKTAGVLPAEAINNIYGKTFEIIAELIKSFAFTVTGTKGYLNAQISVGGADLSEFDDKTMESLIIKNLFCTGELLDVDSICGGFNLQWAWSSGLLAGKNASSKT